MRARRKDADEIEEFVRAEVKKIIDDYTGRMMTDQIRWEIEQRTKDVFKKADKYFNLFDLDFSGIKVLQNGEDGLMIDIPEEVLEKLSTLKVI